MKKKLEINGLEIDVEITSQSSSKIEFIFEGKEYYYSLKENKPGKVLLTNQENRSSTVFCSSEIFDSSNGQFKIKQITQNSSCKEKTKSGTLLSPLPGKVIKVLVKEGQKLKEGEEVLHIEAMKMEHRICAEIDGFLKKLSVKEGDTVAEGQILGELN